MAIPIYIPDNVGPVRAVSPSGAGSSTSAQVGSNCSSPFLHQLILELYSVYRDYCNTTTESTHALTHGRFDHNNNNLVGPLPDTDTDADANNNRNRSVRLNPSSTPTTQRLNPASSAADSEESYKLAFDDGLGTIGRDLRLIADSFQNRCSKSSPFSRDVRSQSPDSRNWYWTLPPKTITSSSWSWSVVFVISGSALVVRALRHVWKV